MTPVKPLCPIHQNVMTCGKDPKVFACQDDNCGFTFTREEGYSPARPSLNVDCESDHGHKMFIGRVFTAIAAWQWQCSAEGCAYTSPGMSIPKDFVFPNQEHENIE